MVWPAAPSPDEMVEIQLIENTQRKNLRPLELATALQQLISISGMTATQVAGRLGLSAASVSRSLKLLELPEAIQLQVDRGEISASSAYEIARIEDAEKQAALAGQVADGRLTRDALSGARKATNRRGVHSSAAAPSRVTAKLGGGRSLTIAGSGLASLEVLIQWLEELLSKARKVRAQNLELGTFIKMLRDQAKA
jgi:ParB family chromosome partitioning protein